MAYEKTNWKDQISTYPNRYTQIDNPDGTKTIIKSEGPIIQVGTPLSASNLNKLEDGLIGISAELSQYVDTAFSSIADGSPKELFYSHAALLEKYPSGAIGPMLVFDQVHVDGAHAYIWNGTVWQDAGPYQSQGVPNNSVTFSKLTFPAISGKASKNLFDMNAATAEVYINASGGTTPGAGYFASDYIRVNGGLTYNKRNSYLLAWYDVAKTFISHVSTLVVVAPANAVYARLSTRNLGTEQFELGSIATSYQAFSDVSLSGAKLLDNSIPSSKIEDVKLRKIEGYTTDSKNLFNKEAAIKGIYIIANGSTAENSDYYASEFMPVKENISYVQTMPYFMAFYDKDKLFISGTQGKVGISPIGAVYARTSAQTGNIETFQFEEGTVSSAYAPFGFTFKGIVVKNQEVIDARGVSASLSERLTEMSSSIFYEGMDKKIPIFAKHNHLKDKDVTVALIGDSYSTSYDGWVSEKTDSAYRPPLCQYNNLAGAIWDKIKWDGQIYNRYDAQSKFVEVGAFSTVTDTAEWGDMADGVRPAHTRICNDVNCSIAFKIPTSFVRTSLIYRSELNGSDCAINIAEGNGHVLVWNGSSWVEANGFTFTMKETRPTAYHSASVYQKRLKMKAVQANITVEKNVTINKTSIGTERFSYWGVEHGLHDFLINFLVVSRGSHSTAKLWEHIQNDLFDFKPDLILNQIPMINHGTTAFGNANPLNKDINFMNQYYFDSNFAQSYVSQSENWTKFNVIYFLPLFAHNALAVDVQGEFKYWYSAINQKNISVRDHFNAVINFFIENEQYTLINTFDRFIVESKKRGTIYSMIQDSSKTGKTFAYGAHPNDLGNSIYARYLLPCFDFLKL
jgi:hypothetical protein